MQVQDLGQLDSALLFFGGPYSNLPATQALIDAARSAGIRPDHMICTGDVVAYCAEPAETVAVIRALGCPVVAGNCEQQLAAYQMDCGCGFDEGSTCDLLSAGWYAHADTAIGQDDRAWMAGLPDIITFRHHDRRCAVIHGGVSAVNRFIWSVDDDAVFAEEIRQLENLTGPVDLVISGHSGIAFRRRIGAVEWMNAGVIGMPPNDGQPDTNYALLNEGQTQIRSLCYDHVKAADGMRSAGLTQGYDRALRSGYWPSEDVLPSRLRRSALASG